MPKDLEALLTAGPPKLGPESRPGTWSVSEINSRFKQVHGDNPLIRALIYLWHDHLDASHQITQGVETRDGSYLHGVMHRREPDFGNAKYWFRRAPMHPILERIALVAAADPSLSPWAHLWSKGAFDPLEFVNVCESAAGKAKEEQGARRIQEIEFRELLSLFST